MLCCDIFSLTKTGQMMKKTVIVGIIVAFFVVSGCESKMGTAGLGALGGSRNRSGWI